MSETVKGQKENWRAICVHHGAPHEVHPSGNSELFLAARAAAIEDNSIDMMPGKWLIIGLIYSLEGESSACERKARKVLLDGM